MSGYTPLFSSIIASTIWRESKETKIVWITMLAMADARGVVEASIPGLADMAKVSLDECKAALVVLSSPDEYSRTKDHDGRRIEEVDGGWCILNIAKFREKCRQRADYMREYRSRNHNVTNVTTCNRPLPPVTDSYSYLDSNSNKDSEKSSTEAHAPAAPPVIFIPVVGGSLPEYPITQAEVDEWTDLFPKVDVPQTLKEIRAWNLANPSRRKTPRGVLRHIVSWLNKEQNNGK